MANVVYDFLFDEDYGGTINITNKAVISDDKFNEFVLHSIAAITKEGMVIDTLRVTNSLVMNKRYTLKVKSLSEGLNILYKTNINTFKTYINNIIFGNYKKTL